MAGQMDNSCDWMDRWMTSMKWVVRKMVRSLLSEVSKSHMPRRASLGLVWMMPGGYFYISFTIQLIPMSSQLGQIQFAVKDKYI